jgi:hypothetical protein
MGSLAIRAKFEPLRSLAYTSITSSYVAVGSPLANPGRIMKVDNLTNALLIFSIDGINNHFVVPANGFFLVDLCSNKSQKHGLYMPTGATLFVKESGTPSSGSVYFSMIYGSEA